MRLESGKGRMTAPRALGGLAQAGAARTSGVSSAPDSRLTVERSRNTCATGGRGVSGGWAAAEGSTDLGRAQLRQVPAVRHGS